MTIVTLSCARAKKDVADAKELVRADAYIKLALFHFQWYLRGALVYPP